MNRSPATQWTELMTGQPKGLSRAISRPKILFVTDSLAFPRAEPEFVGYEDTYLARLKSAFPECDFIHQGRGGGTIVDLYKHSAYFHGTIEPDIVFIQSGVVDCAPRALSVIEQQVVSRLPLVSGMLVRLVKRYASTLRQIRKMTYTPLPMFADYVRQFDALFPRVHWIGILPVSRDYEAKVQGMTRNVDAYNGLLQAHQYVDTSGFDPETMIMSDHHHLNRAGHMKMYAVLADVIRVRLSERPSSGAPLHG